MTREIHWEERVQPSKEDVLGVLRDAVRVLQQEQAPMEAPAATTTEFIASLIWESMTTRGRVYHAIDHVFDILSSLSKVKATINKQQHAIAVLAALFHDVIYLSIDKQLSATQQALLLGIVQMGIDSNDLSTLNFLMPFSEPNMEMVRIVFGYQTRHAPWNLTGLNEFLSALLAVKVLEQLLSPGHLLQIVACIEASIPFRPAKDRKTPMDCLWERCCQLANADVRFHMDAEEVKSTVQVAAIFANCDLSSFQEHDTRLFLDSTWKLLAEWQPALLDSQDLATMMAHLYHALCLLQMRYSSMNIDNIFPYFEGRPSEEDLVGMRERSRQNIARVQLYSAARLVALRFILECMNNNDIIRSKAQASNMSLSSFLSRVDSHIKRDSVRPNQSNQSERCEACFDFLLQGRYTRFDWDDSKSFSSALILRDLGEDQVISLANRVVEDQDAKIREAVGHSTQLDFAVEQALSNVE